MVEVLAGDGRREYAAASLQEIDDEGKFTVFKVLQDAPASHPELRPHRIAIGLYDRTDAGIIRRHRLELDVAGAVTAVPELTGHVRPDLVLVNDDDLSYAKIRLDEHSLATVIAAIGEIRDPLAATMCWAAAWDMTRDAEMRTRDFLALVTAGAPSIAQMAPLEYVLSVTGQAVRRYADPAWRAEAVADLDQALREWLLAAEPGSDHQLAYAQALSGVAITQPSLDLLSGLLAGTASLDGLAVDTDLRWQLLHRLVSRGIAGPDDVAAELDSDSTDAGARRAESCLAAIPSAAAKSTAWAKATSGDIPNATFRTVLRGFADLDQDDLLAPYAAKFYEALAVQWADGASDMAQFFTQVAYPGSVITGTAIGAATDDYIARANPVPPLRRLLVERRDDVARALRCQQRDAQPS